MIASSNRKTYILDTSVLLADPAALYAFEEHKVVISVVVLKELENLRRKITQKLQGTLGILVEVKLVEPKTIERTAGKAKRVIDNRKI